MAIALDINNNSIVLCIQYGCSLYQTKYHIRMYMYVTCTMYVRRWHSKQKINNNTKCSYNI